ncbi:hypothetical protein OEZ86_013609 [Tetradesmus obliquus]|nr:hypothetical protein OEZ86_013609 [Tetradesmus obliquus]
MSKPLPPQLAKVAAKFQQLRTVDDPPDEEYDENVMAVISRAKAAGYAVTTSNPRRGCVYEYRQLLEAMPHLLRISRKLVVPSKENRKNIMAGEMWREAECFLHCPHSMARLKALPELRQIIAHTCLDAAAAAAGSMTCVTANTPGQRQQQRKSEQQRSWDGLDDLDLDLFDDSSSDMLEQGGGSSGLGTAASDALNNVLEHPRSPLLLHLSPALRLCLAAEVAVGMLCAGQRPPPDTPEHAAALQMFVVEACNHAEAEADGNSNDANQLPAALQQSDQRLAETLAPGSDELLRQIQNFMFRFVRKVGASEKEAAEVYVREFQKLGIDGIDGHAALQACAVPHALEEFVATLRKAGLTKLGFDTERFERRAAYRERLEAMRRFAAMRMQEAGLCKWLGDNKLHIDDNNIAEGRKRGILSPIESLAKLDTFPDEEDVEDIQRRDLAFTADVERGTDHEQRIAQQQEAAVKQRKDAAYKQLLDKMASLDKELELLAAEAMEDEDEQQQHDGQGAGECSSSGGRRSSGSEASDKCNNHNRESSDNNASAGSNHAATPPGQASSANGATDAAAATAAAAVPGAQGQRWVLPEEASKAEHALRDFAAQCSVQFAPLIAWYTDWAEQAKQQYEESEAWWGGEDRHKLAQLQARGQKPVATSGGGAADAATAAVSQKAGSDEWRSGEYDYNASCPLCQQDQQQQQQQQQQQKGSEAVPHTDPFMWRRLLWLLLGKLSPASQAFYAQYLAVCPHCPDSLVWSQVKVSLLNSLWSSPAADVIEQQLASPSAMSVYNNEQRARRVRHYAQTVNDTFTKHYNPTLPLLAKQLLLALSPLHAQLLPRPETAFLCPSSFPAAVGKALAGQLLTRPVLDMFQHSAAHLTSWHVHWHIGLRRYGMAKQQQQQQQQWQRRRRQACGEGYSRATAGNLSAAELDQLYLDPDAKVYAVHFASRQLSGATGCTWAGSSSSSSSAFKYGVTAGRPGLSPDAAAASDAVLHAARKVAEAVRYKVLQQAMQPSLNRRLQQCLHQQQQQQQQQHFEAADEEQAIAPSTPRGSGSSSSSGGGGGCSADVAAAAEAEMQLLSQQVIALLQTMCQQLGSADGPLLLRALQCPDNAPLTPAPQRHLLASLAAADAGITAVGGFLQLFLKPEADRPPSIRQYAATVQRVQDCRQQQPLHWLQPGSDVQALALQPPAVLEALSTQCEWVTYPQALQSCLSCCHGCGEAFEAEDERYELSNGQKPGSSAAAGLPAAFWRLLQPVLQPDPERQQLSAGAGALERYGCLADTGNAGVLPMELFIAEAGRLYGQQLRSNPAPAVQRVQQPWKRYMALPGLGELQLLSQGAELS